MITSLKKLRHRLDCSRFGLKFLRHSFRNCGGSTHEIQTQCSVLVWRSYPSMTSKRNLAVAGETSG